MMRVVVCVVLLACGGAQRGGAQDGSLEVAMGSLVEQLVAWLPQERTPKVAVVDLERLSGGATDLERFLAEELTARLFASRRVEVVESAMLRRALDQLKLASSPAVDAAAATRLGQLTGADYVVAGRTSDLGNTVRVNVRAIDATSGAVVATAVASIGKNDATRALSGPSTGGNRGGTTTATASAGKPANAVYWEDFSGVTEGTVPAEWLGAEHLAVKKRGRDQALGCFEPGPARLTIPGVALDHDFQIEMIAAQNEWSGYWHKSGFSIRIGTLVFGVRDRGWDSAAFINDSVEKFPRPGDNTALRVVLERKGEVYRLFVDGKPVVIARPANLQLSATWTLEFNEGQSIWCKDGDNPQLVRLAVYR